jgi:hypothetical protein
MVGADASFRRSRRESTIERRQTVYGPDQT